MRLTTSRARPRLRARGDLQIHVDADETIRQRFGAFLRLAQDLDVLGGLVLEGQRAGGDKCLESVGVRAPR